MPTPTYDLIASNVLTSSASSVTFSSISGSYRDLILICEVLGSGGNVNLLLTFNSDTGNNYSTVTMVGDGTVTESTSFTQGNIPGIGGTTTSRGLTIYQIMDYATTDKHKTTLLRWNRSDLSVSARASRWANTAAITSVTATTTANNYAIGSTFYLYGIA